MPAQQIIQMQMPLFLAVVGTQTRRSRVLETINSISHHIKSLLFRELFLVVGTRKQSGDHKRIQTNYVGLDVRETPPFARSKDTAPDTHNATVFNSKNSPERGTLSDRCALRFPRAWKYPDSVFSRSSVPIRWAGLAWIVSGDVSVCSICRSIRNPPHGEWG